MSSKDLRKGNFFGRILLKGQTVGDLQISIVGNYQSPTSEADQLRFLQLSGQQRKQWKVSQPQNRSTYAGLAKMFN